MRKENYLKILLIFLLILILSIITLIFCKENIKRVNSVTNVKKSALESQITSENKSEKSSSILINMNMPSSGINRNTVVEDIEKILNDNGFKVESKTSLGDETLIKSGGVIYDFNKDLLVDIQSESNNFKTPQGLSIGESVKIMKEIYGDANYLQISKRPNYKYEGYYLFSTEDSHIMVFTDGPSDSSKVKGININFNR